MSKELQKLTDDTYTFEETENENQFLFFRNDHEPLENVGETPIIFFAQHLVEKDRRGELKQNKVYEGTVRFEISTDYKVIRMSVSDNQYEKPDLHIVKSEKTSNIAGMWNSLKNYIKKMFAKKG